MKTLVIVASVAVMFLLLLPLCIVVTIGQVHGSSNTLCNEENFEVMEDSFISLIDRKALLHLKNMGAEGVVITGLEIEGFAPLEKVDVELGDSMGLFGNGIWIDRRTGEIGLNIGGEGFIILDLGNVVHDMDEGGVYTLIIYTKNHGVLKACLKAKTVPIPSKLIQKTTITMTVEEFSSR